MITKEELAAACRAHDNAIDIGEPFEEVWRKRNIEVRDAVAVATQRALRQILILRGQLGAMSATEPSKVQLTADEQELLRQFTVMWLDGLAVGLHCAAASAGGPGTSDGK